MNAGDLPPTQLYASLAFALSVATLWMSQLQDDKNHKWRAFINKAPKIRAAINMGISAILTLPMLHLLVVLIRSTTPMGHQIAHGLTLVLCMVAIVALWVRIIAARPTIGGDAAAQRADDQG